MPEVNKTLFAPVVPLANLHPSYEHLRSWPGAESARQMMDDVYQDFNDPDGNFLEQFQTTGFDARVFELYLFAYLTRSGFDVSRAHPNPDFIVERNGLRVALEATTVNPPTSGAMSGVGKKLADLSEEEIHTYCKNELPIRFGSPLFSKLQKRYWELEHCRGLPFVIAIEAFHDEESLALSDTALSSYVYGIEQAASWAGDGTLSVATATIQKHEVGSKAIPSGFFVQPGAENVSAVVFTNSGTYPKFSRMGYQHGYACEKVSITRYGYCFNPEPSAMDPTLFSYNMDEPPLVESWAQGLVVLHNPRCQNPLPRDFFPGAVQGYIVDGQFRTDHVAWHPMSSKTIIMHMGDLKKELDKVAPLFRRRFAVAAITKQEFQETFGIVHDKNPIIDEQGWFGDETGSFLGVVHRDRVDNDWGYAVLARDRDFRFRWIHGECSMPSREKARAELQMQIARYLSSPKRIFEQK